MPDTHLRRHAWIGTLALGTGLFFVDERTLVATSNPNFLPSVILLGAAVVPAAFVTFIYTRRLPYDVPVGFVWTTAIVGGVIGTVVAGLLEFSTLRRLGFLPMLAVGTCEEVAKLVIPAAVLVLTDYRRRADGLLVGVAAGAGFAALETMGYGLVALVQSHGSVTSVQNLLMIRGLLSPAGHMAWTGVTAAALWSASRDGWTRDSVLRFLGTFVAVCVLHAAWDAAADLPGYIVIGLVSLGALALTAHRVAHREHVAGGYPDTGERGLPYAERAAAGQPYRGA